MRGPDGQGMRAPNIQGHAGLRWPGAYRVLYEVAADVVTIVRVDTAT
jgi:hypothetical protein